MRDHEDASNRPATTDLSLEELSRAMAACFGGDPGQDDSSDPDDFPLPEDDKNKS